MYVAELRSTPKPSEAGLTSSCEVDCVAGILKASSQEGLQVCREPVCFGQGRNRKRVPAKRLQSGFTDIRVCSSRYLDPGYTAPSRNDPSLGDNQYLPAD